MDSRPVKDDLGDVGPAIAWAGEIVGQAGLSLDVRFAVDLGLEEALANLIMHGQGRSEGKDIVMSVAAGPGEAVVTITDRCAPFDVTSAPAEKAPSGFDIGGRGLRLLRAFVSELTYRALGDRNELILTFKAA
ncbi:MAG TPA: ATP-binding protein [Caulobacteraceae bacterium]|jgi:anti-sigma regulatory factor (Ser/Thr protein kinase)